MSAEFITFFIILFSGLFFSVIFRRLHLPWVVTLILAGVIIGPYGLEWFEVSGTFEFLGQIGLVFIMFMAGLGTRISSLRSLGGRVSKIAFVNGLIPFLAGTALAAYFGYGLAASFLLGIVFIFSSVTVILPILESRKLIATNLGKTVIGTTMSLDIASLVLLSIMFQRTDLLVNIPIPLFYILLLGFVVILRHVIPLTKKLFSRPGSNEEEVFEREVRLVLMLLIGTVIIFEFLGLHPVVAGFFAGLILSESIESDILRAKLHTLSYGLFIPIFFIVVGAQMEFASLLDAGRITLLPIAVVITAMFFKYISGYLGATIAGFQKYSRSFIGATTIPQLATTLAVAFAARSTGLIDDALSVSIVLLAITSTIVGTILTDNLAVKAKEEEDAISLDA